MAGFSEALPVILRFEGGFLHNGDDPRSATNKGITQKTYNAWRRSKGLAPKAVRVISDEDVEVIYHHAYWMKGNCDELPWPASLAHFDACVSHGPRNAVKLLQRAAGVSDDGVFGPMTLAAVEVIHPDALVNGMLWKRLEFYEAIAMHRAASRKFLLAWLSRVNHLRRMIRT